MPSEIIPSLDLTPSVPSRIVTITATDVTKGTPQAGKTVTFKLRGDLRVPADGVIISTGSVTLTLDDDGKGRVRLPCYTDDTRADSADGEWYLEVTKSWVGQTDLIRIPVGTSTIALAAIEPVRELPLHLAPSWLVTGAGVDVVEGSQWGATVVVTGGVARFRFTVPPGGTAWARGTLDSSANIDTLRGRADDGIYAVQSSQDAAALGLPEDSAGVFRVESLGSGNAGANQTFKPISSPRTWERTITGGAGATWSTWEPTTTSSDVAAALAPLHELTEPFERADDTEFRIRDRTGRVAFGVTKNGATRVGSSTLDERSPGFRILDRTGRVAFAIDQDGRTFIGDPTDEHDAGAPPVSTLHVFVAAGQSNMSGRGTPVEGPESPRVMQYGANNRVLETAPLILDMVDTPSGTSPATFFAHHYLATQPAHVGVLLVPAARGGTGFTHGDTTDSWTWSKGKATNPEMALYELSVVQTQEAINAAKAAGFHVILKGVLWHQGEGNGGMATATYAGYLDTLIADYRADLDDPHLPFVVGQMCPEGMDDAPAKYTVDAAHQDTPPRVARTGFAAATRDGHNPGDTTHFSTVGTAHLGDTYLTGYIQALGNTHPGA